MMLVGFMSWLASYIGLGRGKAQRRSVRHIHLHQGTLTELLRKVEEVLEIQYTESKLVNASAPP